MLPKEPLEKAFCLVEGHHGALLRSFWRAKTFAKVCIWSSSTLWGSSGTFLELLECLFGATCLLLAAFLGPLVPSCAPSGPPATFKNHRKSVYLALLCLLGVFLGLLGCLPGQRKVLFRGGAAFEYFSMGCRTVPSGTRVQNNLHWNLQVPSLCREGFSSESMTCFNDTACGVANYLPVPHGVQPFFDWNLQASPWEGEGACSERMSPCTDAFCSAVKIPSGAEGFTTNVPVKSTSPFLVQRRVSFREDVASG